MENQKKINNGKLEFKQKKIELEKFCSDETDGKEK